VVLVAVLAFLLFAPPPPPTSSTTTKPTAVDASAPPSPSMSQQIPIVRDPTPVNPADDVAPSDDELNAGGCPRRGALPLFRLVML